MKCLTLGCHQLNMKIIIEVQTPDIDNANEVVRKQVEEWCKMGFRNKAEIKIEG